jgi:hypothetical protein
MSCPRTPNKRVSRRAVRDSGSLSVQLSSSSSSSSSCPVSVVTSLPRSVEFGDAPSEFDELDEYSDVSVGLGERPGGEVGGDISERAMHLGSTTDVG